MSRKHTRLDPDIKALGACLRALRGSSSPRMAEANLRFLLDHYVEHPSPNLPSHLRPDASAPTGPR